MLTSLILYPALLPWEKCALNLIIKEQPSTVSFVFESADDYPSNRFYAMMRTPSQNIVGSEIHKLPTLSISNMIFIVNKRYMWRNDTIFKYRTEGRYNFKLVMVMNTNNADLEFMDKVFEASWAAGVVDSVLLVANSSSSELFTYFPFRNSSACKDTTPVRIGECSEFPEGRTKVFKGL